MSNLSYLSLFVDAAAVTYPDTCAIRLTVL